MVVLFLSPAGTYYSGIVKNYGKKVGGIHLLVTDYKWKVRTLKLEIKKKNQSFSQYVLERQRGRHGGLMV